MSLTVRYAAILVAVGACACGDSGTPPQVRSAPAAGANVLLISVDTLRADHLPAYGYPEVDTPAISRLANEGVKFAAAYSPVPLTLPAHVSLLTGLVPVSHGVRDNGGFRLDERPATLAEVLKKNGYATAAFVSAFVLDSRWGLGRGFDRYFDEFKVTSGDLAAMASVQRPAGQTWAEARTWLDGHSGNRFFAWIHLYDPHTPYEPPAPFRATYAERPYDGEIAYVDSVVSQILGYLESRSLLDKTLVLLVADHGEGLGEHDEDEHGLLTYDSTLRVPWLIRFPDRRFSGLVIEEPVGLVDVFPTIAGLLSISPPAEVDGLDRTGLIEAGHGRTEPLYAETLYPRLRMGWSELTSIRSGEFKYIRAPTPELYNYRADPGETDNLAALQTETVARLDRLLSQRLAARPPAAAAAHTLDPQTVRQLQALGYVSGSTASVTLDGGLPDPKTRTEAYRALTHAREQLAEGREGPGLRALQSLVLGEPDLEPARRLLREYWIEKGRPGEALRWLRSALARHADAAGLWRDMALVSRAAGDKPQAREAIDRALAIEPNNADSLLVLGEIQREGGQLDAALATFKRAAHHAQDVSVPHMQAAQTLIGMRNYADAELLLRSVLGADPNAADGHYLLAQIAEARNQPAVAESEYRQEIDRNPWEYRARFNLGLLLGARGARAEQLSMLRSIPALAPGFGEVYFYIAKALLDEGDGSRLGEAAQAAQRGLQLAPASASAPLGHYVLADIYGLTSRPADAARELQRGRDLERRLAARTP